MADETTSADPVSAEIRARLARSGRLQTELAEAIGLSQPSVSDRLTGAREWRIGELRRVAEFFGTTAGELVDAHVTVSA